jgi:Zn-dependent metalloprotease
VAVFGHLHADLALDTNPSLAPADARAAIARAVAGEAGTADPELVVLPLSNGYHLAYVGQAVSGADVLTVFVDAGDGSLIRQYSAFQHEGVVGVGTGVYGDQKKVSVTPMGGTFVTNDGLRPADITTYDFRGNLSRTMSVLAGVTPLLPSDVASDADNRWDDGAVVDAHVYSGWYYDYLFKRFGRRGIDDRDLRIMVLTHPVPLADIRQAPADIFNRFYLNAFYCDTCGPDQRGTILFGVGAPFGVIGNFEVKNFAAALDVVAHELTHAVTAKTAGLNGFPTSEAGSLNEAFSDVFGASAAFYSLPPGDGPLRASYTIGASLTSPSSPVLTRPLANPLAINAPDHYLRRVIGGSPHANGMILGHAFYLAIEGGTNRTSGRTVVGVGAANREQVEKSFFRALTLMLPSSATFALTRAATLQAARDLYGSGSAAERAIAGAWDAVGVQERVAPTATLMPNPGIPLADCRPNPAPCWGLFFTVSAGESTLRITQWQLDFSGPTGNSLLRQTLTAAQFAALFAQCGPGSTQILAQTDACGAIVVGGVPAGEVQATFTAVDAAGRVLTFSTPRVRLEGR